MKNRKNNLKGLQLVLALQLTYELIEELKETNYYRQEIKQKANSLEQSILPFLHREMTNIYNVHPETVINVLRHQEELVKRIAKELEPHTLCAYNSLLNSLLATPEDKMPLVEMEKFRA